MSANPARTGNLFGDTTLGGFDLAQDPFAALPPDAFGLPAAPAFLSATGAPTTGAPTADAIAFATAVAPTGSSLVSAGAAMGLQADIAAQLYGLTGKGITIGIMSDSFNLHGGYAAEVARGDLNAGIKILKEGPAGGNDEGQAMAELIHKIAPAANIVFYSAFNGAADMAAGIKALAAAGCNAIVDDVTYLGESFYQAGGAISAAVSQVISQGVSYFTSASNEGSNFYEAKFTGVKAALPGLTGSYTAENFGTAAQPVTMQSLTIAKGSTTTIDLQWDQPFASNGGGHSAANSLGVVLYNASNQIVAYALKNDVGGDPVQTLQFTNNTAGTGFKLAIITDGGTTLPGQFKYIVYGQGTTINDPNAGKGSGTIIGHEEVAAANTVGAVGYLNTSRFGGTNALESFSSVGPGQTLFDANGNRLAVPLSSGGVDFLATDGAQTSIFNPFYGTSAAAPDAAAVAALMLQANSKLSPMQVTSLLASSAIKATGSASGLGAGLVQATTAVKLAKTTTGAQGMTVTTSSLASSSLAVHPSLGLRAAITGLAADPSVMQDLTTATPIAAGSPSLVTVDTASLASDFQAPMAAGAMSLALLNDSTMQIPFNTNSALG